MPVIRERVTTVWALLMVATCTSTWVLSKDGINPAIAVVGIFLIAALKVRFVMLDFMELRDAPLRVRMAFEMWIVLVTCLILGFWFATPRPERDQDREPGEGSSTAVVLTARATDGKIGSTRSRPTR
jgi:heme/copper-type cytochrome/quinol oxidase subunit 4